MGLKYHERRGEVPMVSSKSVSVVRADGEGERLWFYGGGVHIWEGTSAETAGAFILFQAVMTKGETTPLPLHPEGDETLYVLEGEILPHLHGHGQRGRPLRGAMATRARPPAF